ncbi:prolyl oligopeptidase family serine peptidase [Candidatus Bathyarchaeota archaeon]|nr:prolyl oligopeptidase family serine peptidase [Candidatus Bathyarchaeota archaeon]MBS7631382.1 prolyl oligopeptidase family serine peptidase [Candidatus Bathyarchaeota archaeon]
MGIIVDNVSFMSDGCRLSGRLYRPEVKGRYPAVALCLGFPGDTKHTDLAEDLAFNGIVSLIFYYNGAWGSDGEFSFLTLDQSTRDAVRFLSSQDFVDPGRMGLIGHSMGSVPLSKNLAENPRLKTGVFIGPVADISTWTIKEAIQIIVPRLLTMAQGKLRGLTEEKILKELPIVAEKLNPVDLIKSVKASIMVIVGSNDSETPPEMCRLLYEGAESTKSWVLIEGANHVFSEHRMPLINSVVSWLKDKL